MKQNGKNQFLLIIIWLLSTVCYAQQIPTTIGYIDNKPVMMRNGNPVLFYGIQYWGLDSWNLGNWDNDICEIKQLGLNGIRLNIGWNHIETSQGVFDFTLLDQLLNKIDSAGLMVYLQFNQSAFNWKPNWFINSFADTALFAYDNTGHKQFNRFSFASPVFKSYYTNYVVNTIDHLKSRSCIVAYSVYTEPHWSDTTQLMDYSNYNKSAYRVWLANRYNNDISKLNQAWNTSYTDFTFAEPYAINPPPNWEALTDKKMFGDWRVWNCVVKSEFINDVIQAGKAVDSNHLYGQNMMWKWSDSYLSFVCLDPEINYEYADIIGLNIYPTSNNTERIGNNVNFIMSLFDNKKIVWLGEMNNKSGNATQSQLTDFLIGAFNAGCSGFVYFMYNGNADSNSMSQYGVMLNGQRKTSWYFLQSYINTSIIGHESNILNTPLDSIRAYFLWPSDGKFVTYLNSDYVLQQHTALRTMLYHMNGMEIGTLTEDRFISGDFDASKPVIVPSMPVTNKEVAAKINEYVNAGGVYFIAGRFGEFIWQENASCVHRGFPAYDNYLNITFSTLTNGTCSDSINMLSDFYDLTLADINVKPVMEKITFIPASNSTTLAKWVGTNNCALITQQIGLGRIMYYGTHLFTSNYSENIDFESRLLKSFIMWAEDSATFNAIPISSYESSDISVQLVQNSLYIVSSSDYFIDIYSILGAKVLDYKKLLKTQNIISLPNLNSGVYILKIKNYNTTYISKILIR